MQIVAARLVNVPRNWPVAVATYGWQPSCKSRVLKRAPGPVPVDAVKKPQIIAIIGNFNALCVVHLKSPGTNS